MQVQKRSKNLVGRENISLARWCYVGLPISTIVGLDSPPSLHEICCYNHTVIATHNGLSLVELLTPSITVVVVGFCNPMVE